MIIHSANFFFVSRSLPKTEDHRTPHGHNGAEERADYVGVQGRGPTGAHHRVVQGRRAAEDPAQRAGGRRKRRQRAPVPEGHTVRRFAVLPEGGAQQKGTGQRSVLVRGQKRGRHGSQPERDTSSGR